MVAFQKTIVRCHNQDIDHSSRDFIWISPLAGIWIGPHRVLLTVFVQSHCQHLSAAAFGESAGPGPWYLQLRLAVRAGVPGVLRKGIVREGPALCLGSTAMSKRASQCAALVLTLGKPYQNHFHFFCDVTVYFIIIMS